MHQIGVAVHVYLLFAAIITLHFGSKIWTDTICIEFLVHANLATVLFEVSGTCDISNIAKRWILLHLSLALHIGNIWILQRLITENLRVKKPTLGIHLRLLVFGGTIALLHSRFRFQDIRSD